MWNPMEIKIALIRKNVNLTELAARNGLSVAACRVALVKPFPAAERVIAKELNVPVEELFPDRYNKVVGEA